jgi:hypothetical protein
LILALELVILDVDEQTAELVQEDRWFLFASAVVLCASIIFQVQEEKEEEEEREEEEREEEEREEEKVEILVEHQVLLILLFLDVAAMH